MATWANLGLQDSSSPLMEQLIFFSWSYAFNFNYNYYFNKMLNISFIF